MVHIREKDLKHLHDLEVSYKDGIELKRKEEGEKLSILSDSMMKTMFQNENRLKYSAKLLSYFLDVSYEELLENIYLSKNEFDKEKENDMNRRGDYVAIINNSSVNIEVNNNGDLITFERNIEYAHRLYSKKVKRKIKGNKDQEVVYTQVIQLNLNNFSFIGNDKIVDIYCIQNDEQLKLTDKLVFIQIYIPNLMRKWYTVGVQGLEEYERYILSLVLPNVEESLEVGKGIDVMEEYVKEAVEVSNDDDLLEAYDKEWAMKSLGIQLGRKEGLEEGRKEGIEKGIEKGMEKSSIKIAKNLLESGMSLEEVAKYTELPLETIHSLVDSNEK